MALSDITNTSSGKKVKKRLSDGSFKEYSYKTCRKTMELHFQNDSLKLQFETKLAAVKELVGNKANLSFVMNSVLDNFLSTKSKATENQQEETSCQQHEINKTEDVFHDEIFIGNIQSVVDFPSKIEDHARECVYPLRMRDISRTGHVIHVEYTCSSGHTIRWTSSEHVNGNLIVNYRMAMAYLCSGMMPLQYEKLSKFAKFGMTSQRFRTNVLHSMGIITNLLRKTSVNLARSEEKDMSEDGSISIMTDARHACRKNSYHTDHVALGQRTHKVVDIQHITKTDERCSQKHEQIGCTKMYECFDEAGINVSNHAHDRNMAVNKIVKAREGTINTNERWHAAKPITKVISKIGKGMKKAMGTSWHPQLRDKGAEIRNHVYWAIENCQQNGQRMRELIDVCVLHFQNIHNQCDATSDCRRHDHVPSSTIITDPTAVQLLRKTLHDLTVYKNAEDYMMSKDTYYIESFNNTCLIYLDKRIHYKNQMYQLRSDLAVLDWNEHVGRGHTSIYRNVRAQHNRRQAGKKTYVAKTYYFVQDIWEHILDFLRAENDIRGQAMSDSEEEEDDDNIDNSDDSDSDND